MTYGVDYGDNLHIDITKLEDGVSMPVVYAARKVPNHSLSPVYGYGVTEADAIVDLLRAERDKS